MRARVMMYKAVSQLVLLYISESWVVTGEMIMVLEGFHHWAARHITGMTATHGADGEWEYPPLVASLEDTELQPITEYIRRSQATIEKKVACQPIYELCVEAERISGTIQMMIWWDQDVVNETEE